MEIKFKRGLKIRIRTKTILATIFGATIGILIFLLFFGYFNTGINREAKASTNETLSAGSFIINMGVTPQTYSNGLMPYGMIYDMMVNYHVPIKWVIEPTKIKDGADFTHNMVTYKGGTFIIPAEYITTAVASRIGYWQSQGIIGSYSLSSLTLPVEKTLTSFPRIMIDNLAGLDSIIIAYFDNASIPSSAYTTGNPSNLNSCYDVWANPHGDPVWSTHSPLYNFVTVQKSFVWSQCHAVSMLEASKNSAAPFEQLNYLSNSGLQCYGTNKCGSITEVHVKAWPGPIVYYAPADPVMQFIGMPHGPASAGSERWFIPVTTGSWRTSTKILISCDTTPAPRQGTLLAYGYAFGDSTNGMVMYQGGHNLDDGSTEQNRVAAQRTFFNYMLIAGEAKAMTIVPDSGINTSLNGGNWDTLSVTASGGIAPYSYSWSSSIGGVFSHPDSSTTLFAPPQVQTPTTAIISCVVTDACGRRNFMNTFMNINVSPLPIGLVDFTAIKSGKKVVVKWTTSSELDNKYFTIEKSKDAMNFVAAKTVPSQGNSTQAQNYSWIDASPYAGDSYYRLKQTDKDGKTTTYNVVKVGSADDPSADPDFHVGPNPFNDKINIKFTTSLRGPATLKMWNTFGRLVRETNINIKENENYLTLEGFEKLPRGTYLLKIMAGDNLVGVTKLMKH